MHRENLEKNWHDELYICGRPCRSWLLLTKGIENSKYVEAKYQDH